MSVEHPVCEDCKAEVHACPYCKKRTSRGWDSYCEDCYRDFGYANVIMFIDDPEVKPFFICETCAQWRVVKANEVIGYSYWKADNRLPLSPLNFYKCPRYRKRDPKQDPVERAMEARAAFDEEMAFSGDIAEAQKILQSFYENLPPPEKPVREGDVTLQEIMEGQHVTGEQFFRAIRRARYA
jgi:hypothetical protein